MKKTFTLEEFLQAAEQNNFRNTNETYVGYGTNGETPAKKGDLPTRACVIGEAFINLGFVPNGYTPYGLSTILSAIKPDEGEIIVSTPNETYSGFSHFNNLADFINALNGVKGYSGKKRIARLIRKHFSQSLDTKIKMVTEKEANQNALQRLAR